MRRQLIVGAAAVTATIVIAFVVPLGLAVRVLAANRPLNAAEQTAQSLATVFALTDDPQVTADAVAAAQARSDATLTVYRRGGATLGARAPRTADVRRAFAGAAFAAEADGARHIFVPATRGDGIVAVVRAVVPHDVLRRGVVRSWLLLAGLAVAMLVIAVAVADWLGRSVVTPVRELAATARRLSRGDLAARVVPGGPPEVADVGGALNGLADRITQLLIAEREMVADLSHRLRTPLTALRIDADAVRDAAERDRLRADVDAVEATVTDLIREAREPVTPVPEEPIDLVAVVRDRAAYWGALADEQGRGWTLTVEAEHVAVQLRRADAEALLDVMLDNVFSHTPEATPYWISLDSRRLTVEDEGPGFADAADAATRRGDSRSGSTGLGLDIAGQIARRIGARVTITPRDPGGTRVEVRLPG